MSREWADEFIDDITKGDGIRSLARRLAENPETAAAIAEAGHFATDRLETRFGPYLRDHMKRSTLRDQIGVLMVHFVEFAFTAADRYSVLPRTQGKRPVIALPKFVLSDAIDTFIDINIQTSDQWTRLPGGESTRDYVVDCLRKAFALDSTLLDPHEVLEGSSGLHVVGEDDSYDWGTPGPLGHLYVWRSPGAFKELDRPKMESLTMELAAALAGDSAEAKSERLARIRSAYEADRAAGFKEMLRIGTRSADDLTEDEPLVDASTAPETDESADDESTRVEPRSPNIVESLVVATTIPFGVTLLIDHALAPKAGLALLLAVAASFLFIRYLRRCLVKAIFAVLLVATIVYIGVNAREIADRRQPLPEIVNGIAQYSIVLGPIAAVIEAFDAQHRKQDEDTPAL